MADALLEKARTVYAPEVGVFDVDIPDAPQVPPRYVVLYPAPDMRQALAVDGVYRERFLWLQVRFAAQTRRECEWLVDRWWTQIVEPHWAPAVAGLVCFPVTPEEDGQPDNYRWDSTVAARRMIETNVRFRVHASLA